METINDFRNKMYCRLIEEMIVSEGRDNSGRVGEENIVFGNDEFKAIREGNPWVRMIVTHSTDGEAFPGIQRRRTGSATISVYTPITFSQEQADAYGQVIMDGFVKNPVGDRIRIISASPRELEPTEIGSVTWNQMDIIVLFEYRVP